MSSVSSSSSCYYSSSSSSCMVAIKKRAESVFVTTPFPVLRQELPMPEDVLWHLFPVRNVAGQIGCGRFHIHRGFPSRARGMWGREWESNPKLQGRAPLLHMRNCAICTGAVIGKHPPGAHTTADIEVIDLAFEFDRTTPPEATALEATEPRHQSTLGCGPETPWTMQHVHYRRTTGEEGQSKGGQHRARHTTGDTPQRGYTNQKERGKAHTNRRAQSSPKGGSSGLLQRRGCTPKGSLSWPTRQDHRCV